jgi:biotin carboxyl carrier protein
MTGKTQNFIRKLTKKYRLSVTDRVNLIEVYSTTVSELKLWGTLLSVFITSIVIIILLLFFTPFKYLIPGYPSNEVRDQIISNAVMVDSLIGEIELRDRYMVRIKTIISGGLVDDNVSIGDAGLKRVPMLPMESDTIFDGLIGPEKYKFSYFSKSEDVTEMAKLTFFPPAKGLVINRFDASPGHFGADIVGSEKTPISAVLAGTVVFAEWSVLTGYVVTIQHDYNLISVYKHSSSLLVKQGDRVKAGDLIAIMGDEGEYSTGPHLHFELWQNGIPLNPERYINF